MQVGTYWRHFITNLHYFLQMNKHKHNTMFLISSGQLPSVAELNYLDKVKWLEMYGVDLHPVVVRSLIIILLSGLHAMAFLLQGEDSVEYFLGLTPSGIIVLRNKNTVGNYYWPRISKIYFKGRYFMVRVTDKNVSPYFSSR